jgi:dUTP pyrophosphatase
MMGVNQQEVALTCTGKGYLPWQAETGDILLVPCFYSPAAADTIISPTDVVLSYPNIYMAFSHYGNCTTGTGSVTFYRTQGTTHAVYPLVMRNGLWFHETAIPQISATTPETHSLQPATFHARINRLTGQVRYVWYHQKYGHPSSKKMATLHLHIIGINKPLRGNVFDSCASCWHGKPKRGGIQRHPPLALCEGDHTTEGQTSMFPAEENEDPIDYLDLVSPIPEGAELRNAEQFHVDFGFARGTEAISSGSRKTRLVTSLDGYRAYLLIIDRKTRYIWIMLAKSKHPPLEFIKSFFVNHGLKTGRRVVRTDKGGELWGSFQFRQTVLAAEYLLEPTAPGAPFQNGMAERPEQTLGNMMRCLLHSANLDASYWSFALTQSVKLYNMLPHSATGQTPYYALTGQRPRDANIHIWGCRMYAKKKGDRPHKLDYHTITGIYLGHTATDKNIVYQDLQTKRIKTTTFAVFDEANYTVPTAQRSTTSQMLIDLGYSQNDAEAELNYPTITLNTTTVANDQLLSPVAKLPTKGTIQSAGYDVYSTIAVDLQPMIVTKIPLDIAIAPPQGTYIQIAPRSSLAMKGITCYAGIVDPDYRGNITVLLFHAGNSSIPIIIGQKIAQIIFKPFVSPECLVTDVLDETLRGQGGFGSTDTAAVVRPLIAEQIINETTQPSLVPTAPAPAIPDLPCNIILSTDPFDDIIPILIKDFGSHATMGMVFQQCPYRNGPQLRDILPSQPASRIKKWRSTIKWGYCVQIEEHEIKTVEDIIKAIAECRAQGLNHIQVEFATEQTPSGIHPTEGIPMLFSDQLNVINRQVQEVMQEHRAPPKPTATEFSQHPGDKTIQQDPAVEPVQSVRHRNDSIPTRIPISTDCPEPT